jgi:hypothetical protein
MVLEIGLYMPKRIWIESQDTVEPDACDVIVEMEDGRYYAALFVTLPYLRRQMELSFEVGHQLPDTPPVRYAVMETPHILVENLNRETIEDTIDNLLALETFETLFAPVLDEEEDAPTPERKLRTAEVAAVVLTEVLMAQGETVA